MNLLNFTRKAVLLSLNKSPKKISSRVSRITSKKITLGSSLTATWLLQTSAKKRQEILDVLSWVECMLKLQISQSTEKEWIHLSSIRKNSRLKSGLISSRRSTKRCTTLPVCLVSYLTTSLSMANTQCRRLGRIFFNVLSLSATQSNSITSLVDSLNS